MNWILKIFSRITLRRLRKRSRLTSTNILEGDLNLARACCTPHIFRVVKEHVIGAIATLLASKSDGQSVPVADLIARAGWL